MLFVVISLIVGLGKAFNGQDSNLSTDSINEDIITTETAPEAQNNSF